MKLMKFISPGLILVLICLSSAWADTRPEAIVGVEGDLGHVITSALVWVINMAVFGIGAVVYLLPTLIAMLRSHNKLARIAALNVFLGWLVIGWIGAIIWSFTSDLHPQKFLDRFGSTA